MTTKNPRSPRLTREERLAVQRLREYLAQFKQSHQSKPQPANRQEDCV